MATWGTREDFMKTWHLSQPHGDGGDALQGNNRKRGTKEGKPKALTGEGMGFCGVERQQ